MGRALVAVALLVVLAGCSATSAPAPGLSASERRAAQQLMSDGYWEFSGLPDDQRPAATPVTLVSAEEWPERFVKCMNDAGFDSYQVIDGGYSTYTDGSTPHEAEALATYECSTSFWVEDGWYNTAQQNYLYDYFEQMLVPCLALHGGEVWGAPSREKFIAEQGNWHPYFAIRKQDQERIVADKTVPVDCPPVPVGMDDRGYAYLWN
jgi:hypothetical protein